VFNLPQKVRNEDFLKKSGKVGPRNEDFAQFPTRVVTKESNMDEVNHDPLIDFFEAPQDPLDNIQVQVPQPSVQVTLEAASAQLY